MSKASAIKPVKKGTDTLVEGHYKEGISQNLHTTIAEICSFIFSQEKALGLLQWQQGDIYVWPLIRIKVFYLLSQQLGLYQGAQARTEGPGDKVKKYLRILGLFFTANPFFAPAKPYAVFVHSRKVQGEDIYSRQLRKELGEEALIFDSVMEGESLERSHNIDWLIVLAGIYGKISSWLEIYFLRNNPDKLKAFEQDFKNKFGAHIALNKLASYEQHKFFFLKQACKTLFRLKKIQRVYIVVAYYRSYIAAAAREFGIPVTELQHGTITPYHLGYSYPGSPVVAYQPDMLLCFGRYWSESTELASSIKSEVIGAPYITETLSGIEKNKEKNTMFFSSQTVIGPEIFSFAVETARLLPDYKVTLNLHPSDDIKAYKAQMQKESPLPPNLTILNKEQKIFEKIAAHEYQAGVFSTTLFEGMTLGAKVILIDLPGVEYMRPLVEEGSAVLVSTPLELYQNLIHTRQINDHERFYAKPVSSIRALEETIK